MADVRKDLSALLKCQPVIDPPLMQEITAKCLNLLHLRQSHE